MSENLLSEFIYDARDHLSTASAQLLELENNPGSLDSLNTLMGTMHTLKGNSGFMDLQPLYHLMHNAETLLQTVREKHIDCPEAVIDLLLQVLDTAEAILNNLAGGEGDAVDWLDSLTQALSEAETKLEAEGTHGLAAHYEAEREHEDYSVVSIEAAGPPAQEFDLELQVTPGAASLLVLADGDLGRAGETFPARVEALFVAGGSGLLVDLKGLTCLSGLELKLLLSASLKKPGRTALLVDPAEQPDLSRLFQVLDPERRLNIFPDQAPALTSFGLSA